MVSALRNKKPIEGLVALDINVGVNEIIEAAKMSVKSGQAVKLPHQVLMRRYLLFAVLASAAQAADVVDRFFDADFRFHPTAATSAGFHEYDSKLEDYSRAGVEAEIASLKSFLPQVHDELILSHIRGELLDLETRRTWEINPDNYSSGITNSAFAHHEPEVRARRPSA